MALAFASVCLVACNSQASSNTDNSEEATQEEVVESADEEEGASDSNTLIANIDKALADGSEQAVCIALGNVSQIANQFLQNGKVEEAKSLYESLKNYVTEKKDALIKVAPSAKQDIESLPNEINEALASMDDLVKTKAKAEAEGTAAAAQKKLDDAKSAVNNAVKEAETKAAQKVSDAKNSVNKAANDAAKQVNEATNNAKSKAANAIDNASNDLKKNLGL